MANTTRPVPLLPGDAIFRESNHIRLESLSRWLQGFEDDDAPIDGMNQSLLEYTGKKASSENLKELTNVKIPLLRLDPNRGAPRPAYSYTVQAENSDEASCFDFQFKEMDEEARLRKAVKRTRYLLSRLSMRLGTSLNVQPHETTENENGSPLDHDPQYDLVIRPASSHHHRATSVFKKPKYTVGVLHEKETTALPLLQSGWTWHEIPVASESDGGKKNVYSLINRGFVPQGADQSALVNVHGRTPFVKTVKYNLNKHGCQHPDKYTAFDEHIYPYMLRMIPTPMIRFTPLPDIVTNQKLQKEIAASLGIPEKRNTMPPLRKMAYEEVPINITRNKPQRPLQLVKFEMRQKTQQTGSHTAEATLTPPVTRHTSATIRLQEVIRTDPSSNWTIFIKDGRAVRTSDAFLNFQAKNQDIWPQINYNIWRIESIMRRFAVSCAEVKCMELIDISRVIPVDTAHLTLSTLRRLCFNAEEVIAVLTKPGQAYKGVGYYIPEEIAARCIQDAWRAHVARGELATYFEQKKSTLVIIRSWRLKKFRTRLYQQICGRFDVLHKKKFYALVGALAKKWKDLPEGTKKVIVQMAPRFTTIDSLDMIIGRVIMLLDPDVETLLLVVPLLTAEKRAYMMAQLDSGFLDDNPVKTGRLKLIEPEAAKCFIPGSSVAGMLKSSHKAMAEVKSLIEDKFAFLITDYTGRAEMGLSSHLNIPLFGPKPEKAKRVNTRHKARIFLNAAGIEVAPGVSFKRGLESQLIIPLIRLGSLFPDVAIWDIFEKRRSGFLDFASQDYEAEAWIDSDKLPKTLDPELLASSTDDINEFNLGKSIKLRRCPSYPDFIGRVCGLNGPRLPSDGDVKGTGGFIQARPVRSGNNMRRIEIGFLVDFTGQYSHLVTCEAMLDADFEQIGLIVPQQRMVHRSILKIVERLAMGCVKYGIFGFVSLQIAVWYDIHAQKHGWWATNFYPFLSPTLLKACSVTVSTGCPMDPRTGVSSFSWSEIPLHLEKTHNATYTNQPMLRYDFENTIRKQAGGATEHRVAIYADNLRNEEVDRMTWRGFIFSAQKDGVRFNDKTRKGSYFSFVHPDLPMMMPMVSMAHDYKSTIEAFLKDMTIAHRRLKHYDCLDLISNLRDIARFFIQEWRNIDTKPQMFLQVTHIPEYLQSDPTSTFFSGLKGVDTPATVAKLAVSRLIKEVRVASAGSGRSGSGKVARHMRQQSFFSEDVQTSDDDPDLTEENIERQASLFPDTEAERVVAQPALKRQTASSHAKSMFHPTKAMEPPKAPVFHLADKAQTRAWWDSPAFVPVDPTGTLHHLDTYDPKNKGIVRNRHFELDPVMNRSTANSSTDLDDIVGGSGIPSLAKLTASKRPVTSLARQIEKVMDEIERLKRPPPPPKAQRSSLSITLLNEGVPSMFAAKHDPTFRKPNITPPFSETERYMRIKRGDILNKDQKRVEEVLRRFERAFEEKYGMIPDAKYDDALKNKPLKKKINLLGAKEFIGPNDSDDDVRSETDLAVAAAFALMKQVKERDIDSSSPRLKSSIIENEEKEGLQPPVNEVPLSTPPLGTLVPPAGKAIKRAKSVNQPLENDRKVMQALDKMAKLAERAETFEANFEGLQKRRQSSLIQVDDISMLKGKQTNMCESTVEEEEEIVATSNATDKQQIASDAKPPKPPSESHDTIATVPPPAHPHDDQISQQKEEESLHPQESQAPSSAATESPNRSISPRESVATKPTIAPTSASQDQPSSHSRQDSLVTFPAVEKQRQISMATAKEDMKKQMIDDKTSSMMAQFNNLVNRSEKEDRLKSMIGNLLNFGRTDIGGGESAGASGSNDAVSEDKEKEAKKPRSRGGLGSRQQRRAFAASVPQQQQPLVNSDAMDAVLSLDGSIDMCATPAAVFVPSRIDITPDPPKRGAQLDVAVVGELKETVDVGGKKRFLMNGILLTV
ncbi:hypothetical protein BC830DRAFT_1214138 [Chytriomyces sp. MP71]|nr:hypothetical protein BC830DRAFT_1214138 [Chytriomyces sp. MP71]